MAEVARETHSPLPWALDGDQIVDARDTAVTYAYSGGGFICDEDAALAVRAVNAHDDLVAALKQIEADLVVAYGLVIQPATDPLAWIGNARDTATAALAKVQQ